MHFLFINCILFFLTATTVLFAMEPRSIEAVKVNGEFTIDAMLDEDMWGETNFTSEFTEHEPDPGAVPERQSQVKFLYSNEAVYVGAILESSQGEILRELTLRDNFGNADYFGLILSPYMDGVNGSSFIVTAAGVQIDSKYSAEGNDDSWDAVWKSAVRVESDRWIVEMKIPFSAFRFPAAERQSWHLNFVRLVRETREQSYWSKVDPELEGILNQSGVVNGISNIESPPRLSATPFIVGTSNNSYDPGSGNDRRWESDFSGGIDLRYGLSDAFTLDMTLIPDFSQARSDDEVLNLSPFEVQFSEQRAFFNEGLELFRKGGIFYTRRVGGRPIGFFSVENQIEPGEVIEENPDKSRLYNAIKVSGRTRNGLGIGVFNGITGRTWATIRNENGDSREILTDPVTNYNMLVFDQALKNNSNITLLNTNVLREGHFTDANVSGALFDIKTDDLAYGVSGSAIISQRYAEEATEIGHRWNLKASKLSGNLVANIGYWEESDDYNVNDLGFVLSNNDRNFSAGATYRVFEPSGIWRRTNTSLNLNYQRLYDPNKFRFFTFDLSRFMLTHNNFGYNFSLSGSPIEGRDYFEPRTPDFSRYYSTPVHFATSGLISTNYNNRFAIDARAVYLWVHRPGEYRYNFTLEPRFRVNDRFTMRVENTYYKYFKNVGFVQPLPNSVGYAETGTGDIIFGSRNRIDLESILDLNYIFTNEMGLTFRARHYWSRVRYRDFHLLGTQGDLLQTPYEGRDEFGEILHNDNFNAFNIDLVYTWRFAPGSDIIFVWKNGIINSSSDAHIDYFDNLDILSSAPRVNSYSLKVVYYLDYLYFR